MGDFTGPGNSADGFLDVATFAGPLYDDLLSLPDGPFDSTITLFRNTQSWGSIGFPPVNGLAIFQVLSVCTDCFGGEIQFADMTGDGLLDIVATSTNAAGVGSVHVFEYDSTTFVYKHRFTFSFNDGTNHMEPVQAFGIGDFTGDGVNDIVVSLHRKVFTTDGQGMPDLFDKDIVYRLQNVDDGNGFGALLRIMPDIAVGATPNKVDLAPGDIVVGEFDSLMGFPGAVRPDFVTAEPGFGSGEDPDQMTLGTGSGAFNFSLSDQPNPLTMPCDRMDYVADLIFNEMATGMFDAGSSLDLVGVRETGDAAVVLLGNGRGKLRPACDGAKPVEVPIAMSGPCGGPVPRNTSNFYIATGQVNGDDTYTDIVVANSIYDSDRYVTILLGNGDGTFELDENNCDHWLVYASGDSDVPVDQVVVADLNNDGLDEILVTDSYLNVLVVFRNDGSP